MKEVGSTEDATSVAILYFTTGFAPKELSRF
jgi:hypothetical protein